MKNSEAFMYLFFIIFFLISSRSYAFLEQTCFADLAIINQPEVEIQFIFSQSGKLSEKLDVQVFRNRVLSKNESEVFEDIELTRDFPGAGQIKIVSKDMRIRIFAKEYFHPITSTLQLPKNSSIRWVSPLTVGIESVVKVICLLQNTLLNSSPL